ncbi:uncharacterized protein PV09_03607 [Verruconis gallopava]|uniref:Ribosome quality control complex subunit 2 n=1 Tax=Verruconis gallopava TaxID=253628 RepID=A0A0D1XSN0_9PEZI|nr:uncharacterized protein PV09_03607 [Verruconis gallopava]KIW05751.1 hypothetical protein PV09_03607 [Verruconis gallopava]
MKQRFSSLDVKVISHELNVALSTLRVSNIYDLSSRIFLFKFAKPGRKEQLVVDSGFRCHLTDFNRSTASAPSHFVQRLRKYLKTRRVTKVAQIGTDRIIELEFSDGLYRLYLEFYAGGNIVLTDGEGTVLSLLRTVTEGAEDEKLRVGAKYNLAGRQNINGVPELTKERIKDGLERAIHRQQAFAEEDNVAPKKDKKKSTKDVLRKSLAVSINEFPPMLVDHAMKIRGFDSTIKPEEVLSSEEQLDKLLGVLQEAQKLVAEITRSDVVKGYIVAKKNPKAGTAEDEKSPAQEKVLYEDFHPFKPAQFEDDPQVSFLEFEGFNKTVDEFFSSIEGQKLESRLHEREEAARKRLQQARLEHEKRISGLQQAQELNVRKAEAILANIERVEEAQAAVNGLIAQGMDWVDISRLIEAEQRRGNPVAAMIKLPLKLYENTVTLLLGEAEAEMENDSDYAESDTNSEISMSDDESDSEQAQERKQKHKEGKYERLAIDIDLALTPWANASQYYDQKKTAAVKESKTVQASAQALKSTERKIAADLKKGLDQEKEVLRPVRKQFWFEKFYYFISSDGYLVLGGRDAQQNELLYKRHLRKGDVYVHADLHGAASVVIKNNAATPDAPIPPSTLSQAGTFSVAASSAWDSKAVMSAYWVNADQVSKTAPTGEYLSTGGFMIRGKKNYLPPAQLLLGFAVIWQISEESKANHQKHRFSEQEVKSMEDSMASTTIGDTEMVSTKRNAENADHETDSDEGFPDATITAKIESDDEDFPDAKLEGPTHSDSDDQYNEENVAHHANPLQPKASLNVQSDDDDDDESSEVDSNQEGRSAPQPKDHAAQRHLTAQERQQLRTGKTLTAVENDAASNTSKSTSQTKPKNLPLPRGKRGKMKKAAMKYADQDEEDRELAMRILGSRTGQDAAAEAAAARSAKKEEEERQKQRRREQHLRAQEEGKAAEARRLAKLEGATSGEDDVERIVEEFGIDCFTGRPLPGDEILAAIPVCAPWSALATYKYKVKLQPGNIKKGKAVTQILDTWNRDGKDVKKVDRASQDTEKLWPREVELIKGMKQVEVVGTLPVKGVRLVIAGGGDSKGGGSGSKNSGGKGGAKAGGKGGGKGKNKK